jgi:hypothetical protein
MINDGSDDMDVSTADRSLETADAVARAAHIWIRSLCLNEFQEEGERHALAGGLIVELCERLSLDPRIRELVAYVYALLDDEGGLALSVSRTMLDRPELRSIRDAYEKGRSEAAGIVEMFAYHDN